MKPINKFERFSINLILACELRNTLWDNSYIRGKL
jgi:hypothetical protein